MRRATVAIDLAAVLLFVVIGRAAHSHGLDVAGVASTAWPFVSGLAVGWLILAARRHDGASFSGGIIVCVSTVALGMGLRIIAGQGTAVAFVLVAMAFLGATMLGSRALVARLRRVRPVGRSSLSRRSVSRSRASCDSPRDPEPDPR